MRRILRAFFEGFLSAYILFPRESPSLTLKVPSPAQSLESDWRHVGQDMLAALEVRESELPLFNEQQAK
jgi:hypothetical protein